MGISDLLPFLRKHVPSAFQTFQARNEWTSIAIDVPIMAHKFACVDGSTAYLELRFEQLLRKLSQDNFNQVHMVFDGAKTPLKDRERLSRQQQRQKETLKVQESDQVQMIVEMSDFSK